MLKEQVFSIDYFWQSLHPTTNCCIIILAGVQLAFARNSRQSWLWQSAQIRVGTIKLNLQFAPPTSHQGPFLHQLCFTEAEVVHLTFSVKLFLNDWHCSSQLFVNCKIIPNITSLALTKMFPKEATIMNAKNKSEVQISNKAYNIWWI